MEQAVGSTTRRGGPGPALLAGARETLRAARGSTDPVQRYHLAHLAALRGAVAAAGELASPVPARGPQRAVWSLLAERAPELTEWAWFLARAAPLALATAGRAAVRERDADDLLRQVEQFLDLLDGVLHRARRDRPA